MNYLKLSIVSLASCVAILTCKAANPPRLPQLTLNGTVTVADGDPKSAYALLLQEGRLLDSASVADGSFILDLPVDMVATLELHMPGHITKRIELDTHGAFATKAEARANKNIPFEVLLFPKPAGQQMAYSGPVGRFSFAQGTGHLEVRHDYHLVDASRVADQRSVARSDERLVTNGQH